MLERISGGGPKPYQGSHGSRSVSKMPKLYHRAGGDAVKEGSNLFPLFPRRDKEVGPVGRG